MQLVFVCPKCEQPTVQQAVESAAIVQCNHCVWSHAMPEGAVRDGQPAECLVCGCEDLWRQKDFPVRAGLTMVVIGAVLSTIAWSFYQPLWAIGILMAFAAVDLVLFTVMPDVLVCYRCGARHRHSDPGESFPRFDLEIAERYRQEAMRLKEAMPTGGTKT